jgi:hypothetical protein
MPLALCSTIANPEAIAADPQDVTTRRNIEATRKNLFVLVDISLEPSVYFTALDVKLIAKRGSASRFDNVTLYTTVSQNQEFPHFSEIKKK